MRSLQGAKAKTKLITKLLPPLVLFAIVLFSFQTGTGKSNHTALAAACASQGSTYGTDTISVNVPATATYYIWTNLQAPSSTADSIMLQVDTTNCYSVGGDSSMPLNAFTWVNYQNGNHSSLVSQQLSAGPHTLEYIGTGGVGVDNVLLLSDPTCSPGTESGSDCAPAQTPPTIAISAPTASSTVSTNSVPITAVGSSFSGITSVAFSVDSTVIKTVTATGYTTTSFTTNWDSTTATNGAHTIKVTATDANGLTNSATETVTVSNTVACNGPTNPPTSVHDSDTAPLPANKVDLSWTAGSAASGCTLAGYNIYRNGSTTPLNTTGPVTGTTYPDTSVAASTTYTYQVKAVDTAGHASTAAPATALSVTTGTNCSTGTGAPTAPTNLAETSKTYTSVSFSWTASTDSNGCSVAGYHVFNGATQLADASGTSTTYTASGLTSGTSYNFTVKAFDTGSNVSTASTSVAMTTQSDNVAPTIPTGFAAASPNPTTINLSWAASTDLPNPGAVGVTGYVITQTAPTNASYTVTGAATTTFSVPSVSPGTKYTFVIDAVDKNNNASVNSTAVSVTTQAAVCSASGVPTTPSGPTKTASTDTSISISWGASTPPSNCTITGYQVYLNHGYDTTVTGTSFTASSLSPNTNYIFTIYAYDSAGTPSVGTADFTTPTAVDTTPPTNPTNVTVADVTATQVQLGWTASTDAFGIAGYNIYRNGGSTPYAVVTSGTSYLDTAASASTTYTYTVQAFDAFNNVSAKVATTPSSITTPAPQNTTPPSTPGGLTVSILTANTVSFSWNASTGGAAISGYNVYRNGTYIGFATSTSYTDLTDLSASTTYNYTLVAVDSGGNVSSASSALSVTTLAAPATTLSADINKDGRVNLYDLAILLSHWHQSVTQGTDGDIDSNGTVNLFDLSLMLTQWTS